MPRETALELGGPITSATIDHIHGIYRDPANGYRSEVRRVTCAAPSSVRRSEQ